MMEKEILLHVGLRIVNTINKTRLDWNAAYQTGYASIGEESGLGILEIVLIPFSQTPISVKYLVDTLCGYEDLIPKLTEFKINNHSENYTSYHGALKIHWIIAETPRCRLKNFLTFDKP